MNDEAYRLLKECLLALNSRDNWTYGHDESGNPKTSYDLAGEIERELRVQEQGA